MVAKEVRGEKCEKAVTLNQGKWIYQEETVINVKRWWAVEEDTALIPLSVNPMQDGSCAWPARWC